MTGIEISRELVFNFRCTECGAEDLGLMGSANTKCPKCGGIMKRSGDEQ